MKMAQMISELHKPDDIMASADFAVINKALIPERADWNIRFATNQLVLCYTDKSRFADEVHADNWYEILGQKGVIWGHSDPNLDPCGYRSIMVLQLAAEVLGPKSISIFHYSFGSSGAPPTAMSDVAMWPSLLSTDGLPEMRVRI